MLRASMPKFYHNKNRRAVIAVEEPTVTERKHRNRANEWLVMIEWTTTCAGKEHRDSTSETYNAGRDSREAAVTWFRMNKYPARGEEIDLQSFTRLRLEYLGDKQKNE